MAERYFVFEPDIPLILGTIQPSQVDPRLCRSEYVRSRLANRIDPYIGCAFDCPYCITKQFLRKRGRSWGLPGWWLEDLDRNWPRPIVRPEFIERLEAELDSLEIELPFIRIGTYTDPYQPIEKELHLTRQILALLLEKAPGTRVLVWTKAAKLPRRDYDLFLSFGDRFRLTVSIDDDPNRSPANKARKKLVQNACRRGITAGVALDPWMPGIEPVRVMKEFSPRPSYWIIGALIDKGFTNLDFYKQELPRVIRWMLDHGIPHEIEEALESAVGLEGYSQNLLAPEAVHEWLEKCGEKHGKGIEGRDR